MSDTDISGLGPKDAYEYVLAFVTTLKTTDKEVARISQEIETWSKRVSLAEAKGEQALAEQARKRAAERVARAPSVPSITK